MKRIRSLCMRHFDVAHSEVRMQSLFKLQRCFSSIRYLQLHAQLRTECDAMHQTKFGRPPFLRIVVALGKHAYDNRARGLLDGLYLPRLGAYESVRRRFGIVGLASKPGKTDRHSTANCAAVFPLRLRAEKEYFVFGGRFPRRHMRAVQIDFSRTFGSSDTDLGQSAVSTHNFSDAGNFELAIQICQRSRHLRHLPELPVCETFFRG